MKTTKRILKGLMTTALVVVILSGCREEEDNDKDTQAASDNSQAEFLSNDVVNMTDAAADGQNSFRSSTPEYQGTVLSTCATVTRYKANTSDPDTVIIDFGPSNCVCIDGRKRRGIITTVQTGNWWTAGSFRTITFSNYYVDDHNVQGTHTATANGQNNAGNLNWTINAQNMIITRPSDGKSHSWNSTRNREWSAGSSTLINWFDDVYLVTGSANGTNINGNSYTASITNPLRRNISCYWLVSGTVVITPSGKAARTLDFGNGNCDNDATVSINNKTYNIKLH